MGPKSIENPQSGDPKSAKWRPMESLGMSYGISDIILKPNYSILCNMIHCYDYEVLVNARKNLNFFEHYNFLKTSKN